jgi:hypothetical protein
MFTERQDSKSRRASVAREAGNWFLSIGRVPCVNGLISASSHGAFLDPAKKKSYKFVDNQIIDEG